MSTALQLLESNRVNTAQAFQAIGGTLQALTRNEMDAAKFKVDVAQTQFQMAEVARKTDAELTSTAFRNNLAAQEHQANMSLMPLRLESEKIRLETMKIGQERQMKMQRDADFNNLTAPWSARVGATFAKNQNPDYAKAYMEVQGLWKAKIARGEPFDEQMFNRDIEYIEQEYGDDRSKKEYNPEVTYYLGQMGATKEQARYEMKNPVFAGNITGLKASAVLGGEKGFAQINKNYGHLFTDEETSNLAMAAQSYGVLGTKAESMEKEVQKLNMMANMTEDAAEKQRLLLEVASKSQKVSDLYAQRDALYESVVTGKPIDSKPPTEQMSDADKKLLEMMERMQREKEERSKISGEDKDPERIEMAGNLEPRSKKIDAQATSVARTKSVFGEDIKGIDVSKFRGKSTTYEDAAPVKKAIYKNINAIEDIEQHFQSKIDSGAIQSIFDNIKRKGSPARIPDGLRQDGPGGYNQPGIDSNMLIIGDSNIIFDGIYGKNNRQLEDWEDVKSLIDNFDGSENQRDLFLRDLYSSLVAADLMNSLSEY